MTSCPTVTVARHHIPFTRPFRKRSFENDEMGSCEKRPKYYFFRLESETSHSSEEETESVLSIQGKETDTVRDTSDTEGRSGTDLELEIEYELATETDQDCLTMSSSSDEEFVIAAAAVICSNTKIEGFVTDGEESDASSHHEISLKHMDFTTCIKCKKLNDNPLYRYCEKCYQDRKTFFPPRPRRKRSKATVANTPAVNTGQSQDSGIGSSQEYSSQNTGLQQESSTNLAKAVLDKQHKEHVTPIMAVPSTSTTPDEGIGSSSFLSSAPSSSGMANKITPKNTPTVYAVFSTSGGADVTKEVSKYTPTGGTLDPSKKRKRMFSESSLSDSDNVESSKAKQLKSDQVISEPIICSKSAVGNSRNVMSQPNFGVNEASTSVEITLSKQNVVSTRKPSAIPTSQSVRVRDEEQDDKGGLCITCNAAPKSGIFLHGSIAHMCCCYPCAIRTWRTIKKCPVCKRRVNNVVKLYT